MANLFILLAQIIVGLNYLLTCFLVLANFSLGWALISFFVVPLGAVAAPFFVNTWGFFLIGVVFFAVGTYLKSRNEKKFAQLMFEASESRNNRIAQMTQDAELISPAKASPMLETDEIRGEGKLFGFKDGKLFWLGENGTSFDIEKYVKSWGKSSWESRRSSEDIYLMTDARAEFIIPAPERSLWSHWLKKHYPDKEL